MKKKQRELKTNIKAETQNTGFPLAWGDQNWVRVTMKIP